MRHSINSGHGVQQDEVHQQCLLASMQAKSAFAEEEGDAAVFAVRDLLTAEAGNQVVGVAASQESTGSPEET